MTKKVNFYTVDLHVSVDENVQRNYTGIKEHIIEIIEENGVEQEGLWILDLSDENQLHQLADVFAYNKDHLFMRASNQKPSGAYLQRNYKTKVPGAVLKGINESEEGIEQYTYLYFNYATGILAIVNQQGAPNYRVLNQLFTKYMANYYLTFAPIPNAEGIQRIYEAKEPKISQIEIEVPVPNADALESWFGWNAKDILTVQSGTLKATMKISGVDRQLITNDEDETKGIIDCIKDKILSYNKARVRAKADGVKTQDYSFFDENFTYPVEINTYKIVSGHKNYHSASELIEIYRDNLIMAYNENIETLKIISNRQGDVYET